MKKDVFRNELGRDVFYQKYALNKNQTWRDKSNILVNRIAQGLLRSDECEYLEHCISDMKFLPGGRYIYYTDKAASFFNNCYLLKAESDTREEWANVAQKATSCLMTGGGIGIDYSILRGKNIPLSQTGGVSSGPISLMNIVNEIGRNVKQGGSRRSAIWAGLNWKHNDIEDFINSKNWSKDVRRIKEYDYDFPAQLDSTNISVLYDNLFLEEIDSWPGHHILPITFVDNVRQALKTGEPGFQFNFGKNSRETLRNACCEVTSEDDSDVCNLGSINMSRIETLEEFKAVVNVAAKFLVCGTLVANVPYQKVKDIRSKNRRIGLGLMGIHEWLLKRNYKYEVVEELNQWLQYYEYVSKIAADELCVKYDMSLPKAYRSIAPTGTIGILAGTTTGIEPIYSVAYKRRYLNKENNWQHQYVIDPTAEYLIQEYDINPSEIETALSLSNNPEKRIKFQYEVQKYVDMAISSTVNLPKWGSELNNDDKVGDFCDIICKYASGLRGLTFYPDGARGGQPITEVKYSNAIKHKGKVFVDEEQACVGGVCGV